MQTDNLELKKLVYLYLMNYAKSQPDMAIMAVNTFARVSVDPFNKKVISPNLLSISILSNQYVNFTMIVTKTIIMVCVHIDMKLPR